MSREIIELEEEPKVLKNLLDLLVKKGYQPVLYADDQQVIFVQLRTKTKRLPFFIQTPGHLMLYNVVPDIVIDLGESNYQTLRQRNYVSAMPVPVVCYTKHNIVSTATATDSHNNQVHFILGHGTTGIQGSVSDSETEKFDEFSIDEFPVESISPVVELSRFLKMKNVEKFISEQYSNIYEAEEKRNEELVQHLIDNVDKRKAEIKEEFYEIHKRVYDLQKDIVKHSECLERAHKLRTQAKNERDRVRFKIERLVKETEQKLDQLNSDLSQARRKQDRLFKEYQEWLSQGTK